MMEKEKLAGDVMGIRIVFGGDGITSNENEGCFFLFLSLSLTGVRSRYFVRTTDRF